MRNLFTSGLLFLLLMLYHNVNAQESLSLKELEKESATEPVPKPKFIGLGIGMAFPKTDLAPQYKKPGTNFSAVFQFNQNKRLNISFWLNIGKVQSEDRSAYNLNQSQVQFNTFASTRYQSVHVEPSFHILKKESWGVFLAQGFGFFRFEVFNQQNQNLADLPNSRSVGESVPGLTVILPTSLGAYYFLENGFGIHFKMGFMNTLTDYIDNISAFGNPDNNDNIANFQLCVIRKF